MHFERRLDEAILALDEAIPLFRKLDERFSLGWALHTGVVIAVPKGECDSAQRFMREGLEIFYRAGDLTGMALFLDDAASVAQKPDASPKPAKRNTLVETVAAPLFCTPRKIWAARNRT